MTEPQIREIRIHGVSGSTPASVLDVEESDVTRVAGDDLTGFFRPTSDSVKEGSGKPPVQVEAYSWGRLTSGARGATTRALWLIFIPFAMVNVASWSRPGLARDDAAPAEETFRVDPAGAAILRAAGVLLTCLLIATAAGIGIDLIAFQCFRGGDVLCPSLPSQAQFLAEPGWQAPVRRIAVGALLPLALLALLWWLGRRTWKRYEATPDPSQGIDRSHWYPHLLERPAMWNGRRRVRVLIEIHLLAGLGVILGLTGASIAAVTPSGFRWYGIGGALLGTLLVVAALVVAIGWLSDGPEAETGELPPRPAAWLAAHGVRRVLSWGGAALLAGYLFLAVALAPARGDEFRDLPFYGGLTTALVSALGMLVLVACVWWATVPSLSSPGAGEERRRDRRPARLVVLAILTGVAMAALLAATIEGLWWVAPLLAGLGFAVAAHAAPMRATSPRHRWGFRGAAPGVLLGLGVGIAVLFSTAATFGVVGWLGETSAVGEPVSTYETPPLCPAHLAEPGDCLVTTDGDAVLVDGTFTLEQGLLGVPRAVHVTSGRLEAGAIALPQDERSIPLPSVTSASDAPVTVRGVGTMVADPDPTLGRASSAIDVDGLPLRLGPGVTLETNDPPYQGEFVVPAAYAWLANAFPAALIAGLVVVAAAAGKWRVTRRSDIAARARADGFGEAETRVRSATGLGRRGEAALGWLAVPGAAALLLTGGGAWTGQTPTEAYDGPMVELFAAVGPFLCMAAGIGILAVFGLVRRDQAVRGPVGIVWDIVSFWPRVSHPFSPPCYAERAVPELYHRTSRALGEGQSVVLSGHSLGSCLAVATVCRLEHRYPGVGSEPAHAASSGSRSTAARVVEPRRHVALLSHGTQLRFYFGRLFPAAFGTAVLGNAPASAAPQASTAGRPSLAWYEYPAPATVAETETSENGASENPKPATLAAQLGVPEQDLGRWLSLFRVTDPLGFTAFADESPENPVDRYVPEVSERDPDDPSPAAIRTHGGYARTPEYRKAVEELAHRLSSADQGQPGAGKKIRSRIEKLT